MKRIRKLFRSLKREGRCGLVAYVTCGDPDPRTTVEVVLELDQAGADCIGINNRNLMTFTTTLDTTYELAAMAPRGSTLISESGIKTPEDVVLLRQAGAHAILVGESLLRAPDPGLAAAFLMSQV